MSERRLNLMLSRSKDGFLLAVAHRSTDGGPDKSETLIEHLKDSLTGSILASACEDQVAEFLTRCADDDKRAVDETPIGKAAKAAKG